MKLTLKEAQRVSDTPDNGCGPERASNMEQGTSASLPLFFVMAHDIDKVRATEKVDKDKVE